MMYSQSLISTLSRLVANLGYVIFCSLILSSAEFYKVLLFLSYVSLGSVLCGLNLMFASQIVFPGNTSFLYYLPLVYKRVFVWSIYSCFVLTQSPDIVGVVSVGAVLSRLVLDTLLGIERNSLRLSSMATFNLLNAVGLAVGCFVIWSVDLGLTFQIALVPLVEVGIICLWGRYRFKDGFICSNLAHEIADIGLVRRVYNVAICAYPFVLLPQILGNLLVLIYDRAGMTDLAHDSSIGLRYALPMMIAGGVVLNYQVQLFKRQLDILVFKKLTLKFLIYCLVLGLIVLGVDMLVLTLAKRYVLFDNLIVRFEWIIFYIFTSGVIVFSTWINQSALASTVRPRFLGIVWLSVAVTSLFITFRIGSTEEMPDISLMLLALAAIIGGTVTIFYKTFVGLK